VAQSCRRPRSRAISNIGEQMMGDEHCCAAECVLVWHKRVGVPLHKPDKAP
jgi:hypothetical protein